MTFVLSKSRNAHFAGKGFFGKNLSGDNVVISGTAPVLVQTTTGSNLSDFVTWGNATAPDGETLTGTSPVREMNINGAGWMPYVGATVLVDLETAQIRETWAVVGGAVPARTRNSALRTTVHIAPVAGTLAAVNGTQGTGMHPVNLAVGFTGQNLTYKSNQPWATVSGSTLTIADEVRTGTVRITATNSGGSAFVDLSVTIAAPVVLEFTAARVGPDLILTGVPDISPQTFTAERDGADLVITFTGEIFMPAPTHIAVFDPSDITAGVPNSGAIPKTVLPLGTAIEGIYTIEGATLVAADVAFLLGASATITSNLAVPTFTGALSPISFTQGQGPQTYEDAQFAFTGPELTWSINPVPGLTAQPSGFIEVDTDEIAPQAGTVITITATNSGGSVSATTTLEITGTVLSFTGLTGSVADLDDFASIGALLSNGRDIDTYRWGSTPGGAEYGGNINPTAFTAGTLYLQVEAGLTYSTSVTTVDLLKFDTQPSFGAGTYVVGDTVVLSEGVASPSATITVEYFRLDGVDKSGELSGLTWDSTGESSGTITARFRASTAGQADVLSTPISAPLNAVAATVNPAINSASFGAQSGTEIPLTLDVSTAGTFPLDIGVIFVTTGSTAATPADVFAGTDGDDIAAVMDAVFEVAGDGEVTVDVGAVADGTYDVYLAARDNIGVFSLASTATTVTVANPAAYSYTQLGSMLGSTVPTTLPVHTGIDTSSLVSGDWFLALIGCDRFASLGEISFDGGSTWSIMAKLSSNPAGTFGSNNLTAMAFEMTGTGTGTTQVRLTKDVSDNNHLLIPFGLKGLTPEGGVGTVNAFRNGGDGTVSGSLAPTSANNVFLGFSMNTEPTIVEPFTFTGLAQKGAIQTAAAPSNRPAILGEAVRFGNAGAFAWTFGTPEDTNNFCAITLRID